MKHRYSIPLFPAVLLLLGLGSLQVSSWGADYSFREVVGPSEHGTSTLRAVAHLAGSEFVAVGGTASGDGVILRSSGVSPISFGSEAVPGGTRGLWAMSVRPSDGMQMAVGEGGRVLGRGSRDSVWTVVPGTGFESATRTNRGVVTPDGANIVVVSTPFGIRFSGNGSDWTTSTTLSPLLGEQMHGVAAGSGGTLATVGPGGVLRWSVDGGKTTARVGGVPFTNLTAIASAGIDFLFVGEGGLLGRFTLDASGPTGLQTANIVSTNLSGRPRLNAVAHSGANFVVVGERGTVFVVPTNSLEARELASGTEVDLLGVASVPAGQGAVGGVAILVGREGKILSMVSTPAAPNLTRSAAESCEGFPAPRLSASGYEPNYHGIDWFAPNGTQVATNLASFDPPETAPGTYRYQARARDLRTGAVGPLSDIDFVVNPLPDSPLVDGPTGPVGTCASDQIVLSVRNAPVGGWIVWHSAEGVPLQTNVTFSPGLLAPGTHTYSAVSYSDKGCKASSAAAVTLTITAIPDVAVIDAPAGPVGACAVETVVLRAANVAAGGLVIWSDANGVPVRTNDTYSPGPLLPGSHTFSATSVSREGCRAVPTPVTLTVTALPEMAMVVAPAGPVGECASETIQLKVAKVPVGGLVIWSGANGTPVLTNDIFVPGPLAAGSHTYMATSVSREGCRAAPTAVTLTITDVPAAAVVIGAPTNSVGECESTNVVLTVSNIPAGGSVTWRKADGSEVGREASYTPGALLEGTYSYTATVKSAEGCEAAPTAMTLTVVPCQGPPLRIALAGDGTRATLSWDGEGYALQVASNMENDWKDVKGEGDTLVGSPHEVAIETDAARFYRLRRK